MYPTTTIRDLRTALSGTLNEGPEYQTATALSRSPPLAMSGAFADQFYYERHL